MSKCQKCPVADGDLILIRDTDLNGTKFLLKALKIKSYTNAVNVFRRQH